MGPEWVVFLVVALVVLLVAVASRPAGGSSTAGHYDPDAIGRYVMDPATQTYRYELPSVARGGRQMSPGTGPPQRHRRRRRRPTG